MQMGPLGPNRLGALIDDRLYDWVRRGSHHSLGIRIDLHEALSGFIMCLEHRKTRRLRILRNLQLEGATRRAAAYAATRNVEMIGASLSQLGQHA